MRRGLVITLLAAFMLTSVTPSMAQVRVRIPPAAGQMAKPPRVVVNKPPANMIKQIQANNPGTKVVGIKPAGNNFVVTIKKGNTVQRINVPSGP